jgi:hypothetical protein
MLVALVDGAAMELMAEKEIANLLGVQTAAAGA